MPVFYFDYDSGDGVVADGVGTTLPDLAAARAEVAHAIAEVAADAIPGSITRALGMVVRDEQGVPRLRASLIFNIEVVSA